MQIVLITGISGSGKSVALNVLEDAGYFCVDNLPPVLLPSLVATFTEEGTQRLAVAVDSRSALSLVSLPTSIAELEQEGHEVRVLFLTADTHSLVARFSETVERAMPQLFSNSSPACSKARFLLETSRSRTTLLLGRIFARLIIYGK